MCATTPATSESVAPGAMTMTIRRGYSLPPSARPPRPLADRAAAATWCAGKRPRSAGKRVDRHRGADVDLAVRRARAEREHGARSAAAREGLDHGHEPDVADLLLGLVDRSAGRDVRDGDVLLALRHVDGDRGELHRST